MEFTRDVIFRILDAIFLACIFLFQNVILNYFLIKHYNHSSYPFLWFLGDFFCLITFSLTLFLAHRSHEKTRKRNRGSLSLHCNSSASSSSSNHSQPRPGSRTSSHSHTSEYNWPNNLACFAQMSKLPCAYMSWILYSLVLIAKLVTLFKSEIPQKLKHDEFFGPQIIKFCIGITALIFSLLVEAHKDTKDDALRNSYVNSVSYGIALEILDSASFLSLLIGSESGLLYSWKFENFIIALSSMNLMLPAIALYKLCVSDFGRTYSVPLETLYKTLHLVLVNGSYLGVRIYLWSLFNTDTSIFIIKNIYSILVFFREIPEDLKKLRGLCRLRAQEVKTDNSATTPPPIRLTPVNLGNSGKSKLKIQNGSTPTPALPSVIHELVDESSAKSYSKGIPLMESSKHLKS